MIKLLPILILLCIIKIDSFAQNTVSVRASATIINSVGIEIVYEHSALKTKRGENNSTNALSDIIIAGSNKNNKPVFFKVIGDSFLYDVFIQQPSYTTSPERQRLDVTVNFN